MKRNSWRWYEHAIVLAVLGFCVVHLAGQWVTLFSEGRVVYKTTLLGFWEGFASLAGLTALVLIGAGCWVSLLLDRSAPPERHTDAVRAGRDRSRSRSAKPKHRRRH